jgi:hydroxymethylbilane synthase
MTDTIRIATRKSPLALWQAEHVAALLRRAYPEKEISLYPLTTQGDRILDQSLATIGGKGLFIKELEVALQEGRADIAVHSMKDVPAEMPAGFRLATILQREDPRDAFVSERYASFEALPQGARLGTSSLRRQAQLLALRPDLEIVALRGNVGTRLTRLSEGRCDAAILAAAGLKRLGLEERVRHILTPEQSLPAVGQGAIGIECRADDPAIEGVVAALGDPDTASCVAAERAFAAGLGASCQSPIADYAVVAGRALTIRGRVASPDGTELVEGRQEGRKTDAVELGTALAEELLDSGARAILAALEH